MERETFRLAWKTCEELKGLARYMGQLLLTVDTTDRSAVDLWLKARTKFHSVRNRLRGLLAPYYGVLVRFEGDVYMVGYDCFEDVKVLEME